MHTPKVGHRRRPPLSASGTSIDTSLLIVVCMVPSSHRFALRRSIFCGPVQVLSTGVLAEAVPHVLCEAPYRVPLSHPALQQSQEAVQTHSHLHPFDRLARSHYVRAP